MRLAFIDLVFTWPPAGGAPIDLYQTARGLQDIGHEVHLFYGHDETNWGIVGVDEAALPFPATGLSFTPAEYTPEIVPQRFREAVAPWKPDVVFICFGFYMKPFVIEAFADYPTISRYYAYETACLRDYRIYKDFKTCPLNYLKTPDACRECTADFFGVDLVNNAQMAYTKEFVATKAYTRAFYERYIESLKTLDAIIVYNHIGQEHLRGFHDRVIAISGGVSVSEFPYSPRPTRAPGEKKVILMTGRAHDASKGFAILKKAGKLLWERRQDFVIWVTIGGEETDNEYTKATGWIPIDKMPEYYQQADICVVPSLWEEPFGIVAVESGATGRPTCVARVGGLQEIILHGETGYIYDKEDAEALCGHLETLLEDADLRQRMGDAARARVVECYDWKQVIQHHYPKLLEDLTS